MLRKHHVIVLFALIGCFGIAGSGTARAQVFPDIEIIDADYGGNGCPAGTASVVIIGNTLALLFDEYVAETSWGDQTVRKSCNYAVALRIPAGYTIALLTIDYRGYADIPVPGLGRLVAEYFWSGESGPTHVRTFPEGFFGNWIETDFVGGEVWAPCGADVIARGNTSIVARKAAPYSPYEAEVQVDSVDLHAGVIFYFNWNYC